MPKLVHLSFLQKDYFIPLSSNHSLRPPLFSAYVCMFSPRVHELKQITSSYHTNKPNSPTVYIFTVFPFLQSAPSPYQEAHSFSLTQILPAYLKTSPFALASSTAPPLLDHYHQKTYFNRMKRHHISEEDKQVHKSAI